MSLVRPASTNLSLHPRPTPPPAPSAPGAPSHSVVGWAVDSTDILRGQKAVDINHNGLIYRLQATRLGKLILTK